MPDFNEWSKLPLFSNSLLQWAIAGTVAFGVLMVLLTLRRAVRSYHKRLTATPKTEFLEIPMEVASHTTFIFFLIVSLYAGLKTLTIGPKTAGLIDSAITIALFWQTGVWAVAAASAYIDRKRR